VSSLMMVSIEGLGPSTLPVFADAVTLAIKNNMGRKSRLTNFKIDYE
jgi:hypothetical protein